MNNPNSRRFTGAGQSRREARFPAAHGLEIDVAEQTPVDLFAASKLVEWFRGDLGVTEVSNEVDAFVGQKAGITLGPSGGAGGRCVLTDANAAFNDRPTVDTSEAGANSLLVTGLATPIWVVGDKPYMLVVARNAGYTAGTDCLLSFTDTAAVVSTRIDVTAAGTVRFLANRNSVNNTRTVTVTIADPALIRAGVDEADAVSGLYLAHNSTSSATDGTGLELEADVTGMAIGSTPASASRGSFEIAEIVLLKGPPSAEEETAYLAYVLARYGVSV